MSEQALIGVREAVVEQSERVTKRMDSLRKELWTVLIPFMFLVIASLIGLIIAVQPDGGT